jgi:hypothetical protein
MMMNNSRNTKQVSASNHRWTLALAVFALLALFSLPQRAEAQWVSGANGSITNTNSGNVGIGTTGPLGKLVVSSTNGPGTATGDLVLQNTTAYSDNSARTSAISFKTYNVGSLLDYESASIRAVMTPSTGVTTPQANIQLWTASNTEGLVERLRVTEGGNVGIGTLSPASYGGLAVRKSASVNSKNVSVSFSDAANSTFDIRHPAAGIVDLSSENSALTFSTHPSTTDGTERMRIDTSGNVGIGTTTLDPNDRLTVAGNVKVTGNIAAKYQDVAEWVPSSMAIAAGTVVTLDSTKSNQVLPSTSSYDTKVAGVVSARPGIALGEAGEGKVLVATTGRVKVKVDATRSPIHVGDLLVTSDKEGYAMKSEPVVFSGRPFHSPGTLIGKALEPLEKGTGEILVLLSLQ